MSDVYPIIVRKLSGRAESSSGGKDYHLVWLENAKGHVLLIQRWGKKNQWGNGWKVTQHLSSSGADVIWNDKFAEKFKRGTYEPFVDTKKRAADEAEFKKLLGYQYWAKLSPEQLQFLDPNADTKDAKGFEPDQWVRDDAGNLTRVDRPRRLVEVPEPSKEDVVAQHVASNSNWGTM